MDGLSKFLAQGLNRDRDYSIAPFIALLIMGLWLFHLIYMLRVEMSWPLAALHILLQTFLCTGLFITAHDAMHGLVVKDNPKWNRWIGSAAIFMYGGFSYDRLLAAHHLHHAQPASPEDPDFTNDKDERFLVWFVEFGRRYYGWREFLWMHIHVGLVWLIGGAIWKIFAFFAVPAWLSAIQLFYFGTYLPHRTHGKPANDNPHRARSNEYAVWLSFLTCYHFGYHYEHHQYPFAPWWTLPRYLKR